MKRTALSPKPGELSIFHNVARALTSELDLDSILRAIMRQMEQFFRPEQWSLLIVDEARQDLFYAVVVGSTEADLRDVRVKMGEGLAGWVAENGETLIIPESAEDPRLTASAERRFRIRSAICMPLRSRQKTLGVIQLFNCKVETLADETISFLHLLCDYAAIAIENAHAVERIQELTITDDCTGLYNQRQLYRMLKAECGEGKKPQCQFSLVFIDLDHFKQVNDTHGHLVGSRLLAEIGNALKSKCRLIDFAFRYGGDEFVLLLPQTSKDNALNVARRLHKMIRENKWLESEGLNIKVTTSLGVASYPVDSRSKEGLLHLADEAMYLVKNTSRDSVAAANVGVLPDTVAKSKFAE